MQSIHAGDSCLPAVIGRRATQRGAAVGIEKLIAIIGSVDECRPHHIAATKSSSHAEQLRESKRIHPGMRSPKARTGRPVIIRPPNSQSIHKLLHRFFLLFDGLHKFELCAAAVQVVIRAMNAEVGVATEEIRQETNANLECDKFAREGHQ